MALKDIGQAWSTPDDSELFTRMLGGCLKLAPDILGGTFSGNPNAEKQSFQTTWAIGIVSQDEAGVKTRVRQMIRFCAATSQEFQDAITKAGTPGDTSALSDDQIMGLIKQGLEVLAKGS